MEAGWLTLATGVPLAVHLQATNSFESPKVWLLRTTAIVLAVAGLVRLAERDRRRTWCRVPAVAWTLGAAGLSGLWLLVATVLGASRWTSLLGSPEREQGALTGLAYLAVFGTLAFFLRGRLRVERLLSALLLGSLPVCLVAVLEGAGVPVFPRPRDPLLLAFPVRSTLGQHSFLAAYLLFVIPVTAVRILESRRSPGDVSERDRFPKGWRLWGLVPLVAWIGVTAAMARGWSWLTWAVVPMLVLLPQGLLGFAAPRRFVQLGYVGLLALQLGALLLSQGRGPWLGFVAAAVVAVALGLWLWQAARPLLWATALALALAIAGIVLLNLPGTPLGPLKRLHPLIARVGNLWEVQEGSPGGIRLGIWRSAPALFIPAPERPSFVTGVRAVIGYGPDSQQTILTAVLPAGTVWVDGSPRSIWIDRAHNDLLDQLITGGLVGLGLWLAVWGGAIWLGIRLLRSVRRPLLPAALLCALLGHFVELQTGVAITTTRLLFWMVTGLLVALARAESEPAGFGSTGGASPEAGRTGGAAWGQALLAAAGILAIALAEPTTSAGLTALAIVWTLWTLSGLTMLAWRLRAPATVRTPAAPLGIAIGAGFLGGALLVWEGARLLAGVWFGIGREGVLRSAPAAAIVSAYERAVTLAPRVDLYQQALGEAYYVAALGGASDIARGSRERLFERAAQALATARRINPSSAQHAWSLARVLTAHGTLSGPELLEAADTAYAQAMSLSPRDAVIVAERGDLALSRGRPAEAIRWARQALALDPGHWAAHAVLARGTLRLGRLDEARQAAAEALRLAPASVRPRLATYLAGLD